MQMDDGHLEKFTDTDMMVEPTLESTAGMAIRNPDLVFRVGEQVKVKDGDFKIKSIGKKMMVLEGLPGTRIGY